MRSVLCDRLFTSHGLLFAIYLSSLANQGAARLNHQQDALRRGLGINACINGHPMRGRCVAVGLRARSLRCRACVLCVTDVCTMS